MIHIPDFRGKSIHDSKWLFGNYAALRDVSGNPAIIPHGTNIFVTVWSESVGQFTGLIDRRGERIFRGDIIRYDWNWDHEGGFGDEHRVFNKKDGRKRNSGPFIGFVEWTPVPNHAEWVIAPGRLCLKNDSTLIEVIGNIFDNPDMVKGAKNWGKEDEGL